MCKHLRLVEKASDGTELFECRVKNIRFRFGAPICFECNSFKLDESPELDLFKMPARFLHLTWCGNKLGENHMLLENLCFKGYNE